MNLLGFINLVCYSINQVISQKGSNRLSGSVNARLTFIMQRDILMMLTKRFMFWVGNTIGL